MAFRNRHRLDDAFYRFKNCSRFTVNVYWSTPSGLVYYNCLAPEQFLDVNTYETHIWVFVNVENGNRLWADGCFEFCSNSWQKELRLAKESGLLDESHLEPFRKLVKITYPMHNLTHLAMEAVRDTNVSFEDVDKLELPITLQSDLRKMILTKRCAQLHNRECNCLTKLFKTFNH